MAGIDDPVCVLITGASGGIGGALALEYATKGRTLVLHGRQPDRLAALATACRERGAHVISACFDLRETDRLLRWLAEVDAATPLDLVVANAGLNTHTDPAHEGERWEKVEALLEVNIKSVFATVHGVLPAMRTRGKGQIALVSSLAAWRGLPETPSYSASKAAIKVYGEALRDTQAREGVRINVVMPGYVASRMCAEMPGPKPFLWTPERAARFIRRGLAANRARISFPFPLNTGCYLLAFLPPALSGKILGWLNYGG